MSRRRRRAALADMDVAIGPHTQRLQAVRAGVRGVRKALDRKACRDAAALLKLTDGEARRLPSIDRTTRHYLDVERDRFKTSCHMTLGRPRRRRKGSR